MKKYLLDTNICIYYIKGMYELDRKFEAAGVKNCFISEVSVAELKYGVANSKTPHLIKPIVEAFIPRFAIIPIFDALDIFALEKARLRKNGEMVDDFDILIGATAITHGLTMVTNNTRHLGRLNNILLQDWTTGEPG